MFVYRTTKNKMIRIRNVSLVAKLPPENQIRLPVIVVREQQLYFVKLSLKDQNKLPLASLWWG